MSASKSSIKSKQDKRAPRQLSRSAPTIEISSDSLSPDPQPIEKRRSKPQSVQSASLKINNFNQERFRKVDYVPAGSSDALPLLIVSCEGEDAMQHAEARSLLTYKIDGTDSTRYVSDLYLHQRVQKILQPDPEPQAEPSAEALPTAAPPEEEGPAGDSPPRRRARYFDLPEDDMEDEKRAVKCYRCNKRGHIAKNCLQERERQKCMYCLGEHYHHDCNSRACFRCNELGHVAQECKAAGIECRRCHKKGHAERICGSILFLDYAKLSSDREFRERYQAEDLRKVRCLNGCKNPNGHFNCYEYNERSVKPYHRQEVIEVDRREERREQIRVQKHRRMEQEPTSWRHTSKSEKEENKARGDWQRDRGHNSHNSHNSSHNSHNKQQKQQNQRRRFQSNVRW